MITARRAFFRKVNRSFGFYGCRSQANSGTACIYVGAHIAAVAGVKDMPFNPLGERADTFWELAQKSFPVLDDAAGVEMQQLILAAKQSCDSVGGVIECMA